MKKFFIIGIIATILIAVPLTAYLLINQKTNTQSGAAKATILSFDIPTSPAVVGTPISIPVKVDPTGGNAGTSSNQVSFIKLVIKYDGNVLQATNTYFTPQGVFAPNIIEGPSKTCDASNQCSISATISTGADPKSAVKTVTPVALLGFTPLAATAANTPTTLSFDTSTNATQVLSIAVGDKPAENVLSTGQPGSLTVVAADVSPTAIPTPTTTSSSGSSGGSSGNGGGSTTPLTCSSLSADNTTATTAPFTVLLTATGTSSPGNITKVSFNYGDGTVQNVTSGGGIGTTSVSVQTSHIYKTTGTFTATAILTDDAGNTTAPSSCSQTIAIGTAASPTPTPASATATPASIPATGPGNTIVGVGVIGLFITAAGLFLAFGI